MKKRRLFFLSLLVAIAFFLSMYFQSSGELQFYAHLLRDGDYLFNLVNKERYIGRYAPQDLVELSGLAAPGKYIRQPVYEYLGELVFGMEDADLPIKILSSYRSYKRQRYIFSYWSTVDREASRFSAEAGHSEHQLGTTIDFGIGNSIVDFKETFAGTPQSKWLEKNAWKYGFAQSYPEGQELSMSLGITGL